MGKNRRAGRHHKSDIPKMWIKCVCGQTLGEVTRPRWSDGFAYNPSWEIGGLSISHHYNSHHGERFAHDQYGQVHTYTFRCSYDAWNKIEVLDKPTEDEIRAYAEEETLEELMGEELPFRMTKRQAWHYRVHGELPHDVPEMRQHPALKANPARFTEAGVTQRPRDIKRLKKRCGRNHVITGKRIFERWQELAGINEEMDDLEAMRHEKQAYKAAGRNWILVLTD